MNTVLDACPEVDAKLMHAPDSSLGSATCLCALPGPGTCCPGIGSAPITVGTENRHATTSAATSAERSRVKGLCRRRVRAGAWAGVAIGRVILGRPSHKGTALRKAAT